MTLSFSTHFKDETPNYFVEKILHSFPSLKPAHSCYKALHGSTWEQRAYAARCPTEHYDLTWFGYPDKLIPKIHTIRRDEKRRWKSGMDINFVLFNRTKKRWEFITGTCTAVQSIRIQKAANRAEIGVWIDGKLLEHDTETTLIEFVYNDGFETIKQFKDWFAEDFEGVLIHWTDKRY